MKLRTVVCDALYLNWAVPAAALPPPPDALRYQLRDWDGERWAFVSALLFYTRGLHLPHLPFLRFSYPQLNLRLYVRDGDGVPSVVFLRMLLPPWVQPAARLVGKQPASAASFDYPQPSRSPEEESWRWRVRQGAELVVTARRSAPVLAAGPSVGEWDETVRFFRERSRGYVTTGGRLRRLETEHPAVPVWPVTAEVADASLLARLLPGAAAGDGDGTAGAWPALHSAWLCPQIPFVFALDLVPEVEMRRRMPQAATSTRAAL